VLASVLRDAAAIFATFELMRRTQRLQVCLPAKSLVAPSLKSWAETAFATIRSYIERVLAGERVEY
jgi:hypothetical protein